MARARNIKPGFFRNADLAEVSIEARLLFIGLWTLADREGRLEDRPKQIKMEIFPADSVDCEVLLVELAGIKAVTRYEIDGRRLLQVVNFGKHQHPHWEEKGSDLPAPDGTVVSYAPSSRKPKANPGQDQAIPEVCRAVRGLIPDSLIPDSLIPEKREGMQGDAPPPLDPLSAAPPAPVPLNSGVELSEGDDVSDAKPDQAGGDRGADLGAKPKAKAKTPRAGGQTTFDGWAVACKQAGVSPLPEDDFVFEYARTVGIPEDFLRLHWTEFKNRYSGNSKRYTLWNRVFLRSVKENWFSVWAINRDGEYFLTTIGKQADRDFQARLERAAIEQSARNQKGQSQ